MCGRLACGGVFGVGVVAMMHVVPVVARMVVPATGSKGGRHKQQNKEKREEREAFHDEQATTHARCVHGQMAGNFQQQAPETATGIAWHCMQQQRGSRCAVRCGRWVCGAPVGRGWGWDRLVRDGWGWDGWDWDECR